MRQATVCGRPVTAAISIQTGRRRHRRSWFARSALLAFGVLAMLATGAAHAADAATGALMRQAQAGDRFAQMTIADDFRQGAGGLSKDDRQALI